MNCAECRENLVAWVEGLLPAELSNECQAHVEQCTECRGEYGTIQQLQEQLVIRGRASAQVALVRPVMERVVQKQIKPERMTIMRKLLQHRWGMGLGAAIGAAAIFLILALATPKAEGKAAEILAKSARALANLGSIHLRGQIRTQPQDNFSYIDPNCSFYSIELWKQFEPVLKWRVEKPQRVAVMDGQSTLMLIRTADLAMKVPKPATSAFDTEWLHKLANLGSAMTNELRNALAKGWKMQLVEERGEDGRAKDVVTIHAKAGLPDNDYLKNKFFDTLDSRRVYRFDAQSEMLEAVQVFATTPTGEVLVFELQQIEYNQPVDPAVFNLELPPNVHWYQNEMSVLPDNAKYAAMSPEQAARTYFEAFARQDWAEAEKFRRSTVDDHTKQLVGGLEVISIGQNFTSQDSRYPGCFVPYELKLKNGQAVKHNIALKKDQKTGRWFVDGGGF